MADQRIVIDILNHVEVKGTSTKTPNNNLKNKANLDLNKKNTVDKQKTNQSSWNAVIAANFMKSKSGELLNIFSNITGEEGYRQTGAIIGKVAKYATLTARAVSMDPIAIADLAISLVNDITTVVSEQAKKTAAENNKLDELRINAGVMDISGLNPTVNSTTGRINYLTK